MVRYLQDGFRVSERRACRLIELSRTSHRYQSTRTDDPTPGPASFENLQLGRKYTGQLEVIFSIVIPGVRVLDCGGSPAGP